MWRSIYSGRPSWHRQRRLRSPPPNQLKPRRRANHGPAGTVWTRAAKSPILVHLPSRKKEGRRRRFAMTDTSDTHSRYDGLLLDVRRSVRYHTHRRAFFEGIHSIVLFVGLVGGSSAIIALILKFQDSWGWSEWWLILPGALVTIASAADLVVGTMRKAWRHADLARRFIELEQEMEKARRECTDDYIVEWTTKRLSIEAEEPQIMRILDIICHNEIALSIGDPDLYYIPWWQRCIAHFSNWRVESIGFAKSNPRHA